MKGTKYKVYASLPERTLPSQSTVFGQSTATKKAPNKDHEDDDQYSKDLHQTETKKIYHTITGNSWTRSDSAAYARVKHVPIERIKDTLQEVVDRAKDRPRSLNYFVAELLSNEPVSKKRKLSVRRSKRSFYAFAICT